MSEFKAIPSFRVYGKTHMAIQRVTKLCQYYWLYKHIY